MSTFPADMPALDRQNWSDKHTEQGKPRSTEPKFNLKRLKRRKLKDDPTDQELPELSNLSGRHKSNPTLELQIKGLSRYSLTYNDDNLKTTRIARVSNPDAQESREAKQRYAQKKRKYKKMIANFADRMQELITITLPFADIEWTACVCVCVCVCTRERKCARKRERERERDRVGERRGERYRQNSLLDGELSECRYPNMLQ